MREHHSSALIVPVARSPKFADTDPSQLSIEVSQITVWIHYKILCVSKSVSKVTYSGMSWYWKASVKETKSNEITHPCNEQLSTVILGQSASIGGIATKGVAYKLEGRKIFME